jgi:hypothetical protein
MIDLAISAVIFACLFGAALLGFWLRTVLPEEQLSPPSKDLIKLGVGTIATVTGLVLGLLVASATSSYNAESRGLTEFSARIIILDRVLAHYGPETQKARSLLKVAISDLIENTWAKGSHSPAVAPTGAPAELLYEEIEGLVPKDDTQRALQNRAIGIAGELLQTRWLMGEQVYSSVSVPLLVVVVFSLMITFTSFGLHAPPNATILATFFLSALAVAALMFLILEMYRPFGGLIPISSAPLRGALQHLGQ